MYTMDATVGLVNVHQQLFSYRAIEIATHIAGLWEVAPIEAHFLVIN